MLFRHHHVNPMFFLRGNHLNGGIKRLAFKTLGRENLTDLFALTVWRMLDVAFFHMADEGVFLDFRLGAGIVRGRHGKTVSQQVCHP